MPTIDRTEQAVRAGKRLREMRTAAGLTGRQIEQKTREKFGEGREINETQNSRIEKGNIDRISFEDAMKLAWIYGLSPQQMAVIFGLLPEYDEDKLPKEIRMALVMASTLDEEERRDFLWEIDYDTKKMKARLKMRGRGLNQTPESQSDWGKYRSSTDE